MHLWSRTHRLRRFGTASFVSYLLYLVVYVVLTELGIYFLYSALTGFVVYYIANVAINKQWVFRSRFRNLSQLFLYLVLLTGFDVAILFFLWVAVDVLNQHYAVSQLIVSGGLFPLVWYFANQIFLPKGKGRPS